MKSFRGESRENRASESWSDPADARHEIEQRKLLRTEKAEKGELVLADNQPGKKLSLAAVLRKIRDRRRGGADSVNDTLHIDQHALGIGSGDNAAQTCNHL